MPRGKSSKHEVQEMNDAEDLVREEADGSGMAESDIEALRVLDELTDKKMKEDAQAMYEKMQGLPIEVAIKVLHFAIHTKGRPPRRSLLPVNSLGAALYVKNHELYPQFRTPESDADICAAERIGGIVLSTSADIHARNYFNALED